MLAGKYRVERKLGKGGMGLVVAAEHVELRSMVALKVLADHFVQRPDVVERFMREARACAGLRSEHICRVTDVGRLETGTPFIVMELLDGRDLAHELRARTAIEFPAAADYVRQACDAVAEAHAANIVHRDLKPANLFLTQRRDGSPLVKVLDFGVAKAASDTDLAITQESTVVGSPKYMAPEQLRSAQLADSRSDIWSLGIVLYELISGAAPFGGGSIPELAIRVLTDVPVPLPSIPWELWCVISRCLEKDPAHRFQSAHELAAALAPFSASMMRSSVPAMPYAGRDSGPAWSPTPPPHTGSSSVSYGGSQPGSYAGSPPGSYPGSHPGSYPGSHPGSYAGSQPSSQAVSYAGSHPGSYAGSHPGSHPGAPGGHGVGSQSASGVGSYPGSASGAGSASGVLLPPQPESTTLRGAAAMLMTGTGPGVVEPPRSWRRALVIGSIVAVAIAAGLGVTFTSHGSAGSRAAASAPTSEPQRPASEPMTATEPAHAAAPGPTAVAPTPVGVVNVPHQPTAPTPTVPPTPTAPTPTTPTPTVPPTPTPTMPSATPSATPGLKPTPKLTPTPRPKPKPLTKDEVGASRY